MDMLQMPVTLIVKAPNQRVDDHVVNCGLGWTVKKLKQHLSTAYPNQPNENQQRIIYSGKLLQDHHTLKEVLKHSYEESQTQHTVHLLCSATMSDINEQGSGSSKNETVTKPANPEVSEGLRHRNVTTSQQYSNVNTSANTSVPVSYMPYPSYPLYTANGAPSNPAMMQYPGQYQGHYNQMMYYQQMYAHQMAQYMQYMQQVNHSHVAATTAQPAAAADNVAPQDVANQAPAQQQNQNNQQMVMNAAGGQAMFEDEEDLNRDWLDWSYILCRFAMLIAIVYFYSTLGRFFMVFCFFFVIYLYQSGWFRLTRRPAPQNQQNEEIPQAAQQPNENENEAEDDNGNNTNDTPDQEPTEPVPPPPPPSPGMLRIALSFFVTFFTSLVPQQPGAVNAN